MVGATEAGRWERWAFGALVSLLVAVGLSGSSASLSAGCAERSIEPSIGFLARILTGALRC